MKRSLPSRSIPTLAATLVALTIADLGVSLARPPPPPPPPPYEIATDGESTLVEWSTWLRGGFVVAESSAPTDAVARRIEPAQSVSTAGKFDGAIGGGFTLPVGSRLRVGPWAEFRSWGLPLVGGELNLVGPRKLDLFFYEGQGITSLRVGGNPHLITAQIGFGYQARWNLFGEKPRGSSYMIGVRAVATATQSRYDKHDWSASVGLEFEPVGATRYLLGIRSWYH
jgi:hypothetical protein